MSTLLEDKVTLKAIGELIVRSVSKLATKEELKETVEKAVDDLAGAVKKGFDEVHEKIDKIEFKVERMDTRFTNQLDYISLWYPSKSEFTELNNRVKKIEKKVGIKA